MDVKEFKEKFKVGDLVTRNEWYGYREITAIGINKFMYLDNEGNEFSAFIEDEDWIKPPEPKEQDFAYLFPAVVIYDNGTTREVTIKWVDGKTFEDYQDKNNFSCISIEEAKERGLNLNLLKQLL